MSMLFNNILQVLYKYFIKVINSIIYLLKGLRINDINNCILFYDFIFILTSVMLKKNLILYIIILDCMVIING